MIIINLFTILPLTCALFVLLLGFYILAKNHKSRMHQLLAAFCGCMFFWLFGTFMMFAIRAQDAQAAVFWDRFVYFGVVLMPALMQHFSLVFAGQKGQRRLLVANYIFGVFFLFISRTPYFVDGLYVYDWGAHSRAEFFHHVFLAYFFLSISLFFSNLIRFYKRTADRAKKKQAISVFTAFGLVMLVGGTAYLYAYNIDTRFPFAYLSGLTFPLILFYTLIRHGWLQRKVIATEVIVGLTNFVLVTQIFLSKTVIDLVLRSIFAAVITLIGVLLVKSVQREIQRREEVAKLAERLKQANSKLKELDELKTEFLSIASHQLRTPLSIIKGYGELLKDGAYGQMSPPAVKILDNIDESNERLIKLVDEFLNVSRIEQGRTQICFAPMDMAAMAKSVTAELSRKAAPRQIKIQLDIEKEVKSVIADEEKLRHCLYNFVDNAIKYSPEKSVIKVRLEKSGPGVKASVRDQGFGLDSKDIDNLFQKFYRSPHVIKDVQGTGLGLFVVRQFIEAHRGRVYAKSQGLGKGSEFGFVIPAKAKVNSQMKICQTRAKVKAREAA